MAFLDWLQSNNTSPAQQPVAQTPQPVAPAQAPVASLPDNIKAAAVDAARPAAEIMGKGAQPSDAPVNPSPSATPNRGRSLGWER